ncbi:MAG: nitroreductase [Frankiales bacterium]|nr:nitroreductase [Frankiales bacterium]
MTAYAPSPVDWVRDDVEHYERTGTAADGRSVVVLTTTGARTGLTRKTPLMRVESLGVYAVVASQGGAPNHPHWYANVLADPRVLLQDGMTRSPYLAREVTGAERTRWWSTACVAFPSYADYQSRTSRRIPVIVLDPML